MDADFASEILKQVEKLSRDQQEQVLKFAASLASQLGPEGSEVAEVAQLVDSESVEQVEQAIKDVCEQVDSTTW